MTRKVYSWPLLLLNYIIIIFKKYYYKNTYRNVHFKTDLAAMCTARVFL